MSNGFKCCVIAWLVGILGMGWASARAEVVAPPNRPAELDWNPKGEIRLRYHGDTIFDGVVFVKTSAGQRRATADEIRLLPGRTGEEKVEQRLAIEAARPQDGLELLLQGAATGSEEAFAAETPSPAQKRFPCIRNSVGPSRNLRNNAVYDRRWDWVLVGPGDGHTRVEPLVRSDGRRAFSWQSRGARIELVFRPRFYQKHKNLKYFQPWTYKVWKGSVTGWSSWWAYQDAFNQKDLDAIVDVLAAKNLPAFGYRYIQIDDCFETGRGLPETWLHWNEKFPGGPEYAVRKIRSGGMDPALWIGVNFNDEKNVRKHPEWFVRDSSGRPFRAVWNDYGVDATNPEALDAILRPTYQGLKNLGFRYVKVDGLRHLLYDSYHNRLDYLGKKHADPADVFRKYLGTVREELGRDVFLLSCWGVLPEVIGIADGCRLGTDGFGPATLQQYNSFNGVVWRSDPDHCDILPGGRRAARPPSPGPVDLAKVPTDTLQRPCLASMAGAMLLLSDRPGVYADDNNLEGVKRSGPILFTVPGQLYDFDPRKSDNVVAIPRTAITAGGPVSPIDAEQQGVVCPWWLLEIDRPFEHWMVLAHFNWQAAVASETRVSFADLGLAADHRYLVYEFWTGKFLGGARGSFTVPALRPGGLQVFALRGELDRPQVLSTSRHISQGGVDLAEVAWRPAERTLRGRSAVIRQDRYELVIHVPATFRPALAQIDGKPVDLRRDGEILRIAYSPSSTGTIAWSIQFNPVKAK